MVDMAIMAIRELCRNLAEQLAAAFSVARAGLPEREDSRAFGAMIEAAVSERWSHICASIGVTPVPRPGRRTIYDAAFQDGASLVGVDIRTKALDSTKYSDGGICAVANLMRFLANEGGIFLIAEFGHQAANQQSRRIEYVRVAPLIMLPYHVYRIENLGTGQVRLDRSINETWGEIEWDRDISDFYATFVEQAIRHYQRVATDAGRRIACMQEFQRNGYTRFNFA